MVTQRSPKALTGVRFLQSPPRTRAKHGSGLPRTVITKQSLVRGASNRKIMFYVYFLRSRVKRDQLYVGYSEDLKARFKKHNAGEVKSTKPYRPWDLIYYEAFASKKDAKQREQYLKTTKGRRTLRLMLQNTLGYKDV